MAANILRRVWSRTNTCSHAKRKLRAYDSYTELGSASAYLWRNLSSRSTTSLPAARADGIVAAKSLTKIRVQTIKAAHPGTPRSVVPPQSWGDRSDTKHSKCLLLGGRRLNQLTLIPNRREVAAHGLQRQVGQANNRNDTKRCLPVEASLRPGKPSPGKPQSAQQSQTQVFSTAARPQVPRGDVTHCFYSNRDVINV